MRCGVSPGAALSQEHGRGGRGAETVVEAEERAIPTSQRRETENKLRVGVLHTSETFAPAMRFVGSFLALGSLGCCGWG